MPPSALLFDMDGTLTQPMLDFPAIKREMGIGNRPILEVLAGLDPNERQFAEAILHRHEERAAAESTLNHGCANLLDWIERKGIPVALITRNSRKSADVVLARHGLMFEVLITRDDGLFKPDPTPLLIACRRLKVRPDNAWMIGDGKYDIQAGLAAGTKTVWISHGRKKDFVEQPWQEVVDLEQLLNVLMETVSQ